MKDEETHSRTVVVSGAASGIGRATARLLAKRGARVALWDVDTEGGKDLAEELGDTAAFHEVDVTDEQRVRDATQAVVEDFGRLDAAVNNAGVGGPSEPLGAYPTSGWETVIGVNLTGVFLAMRHQLDVMAEQEQGRIVNMASILGDVGFPGAGAYVAAKHGVVGLTQTAAQQYASQGIRVNAVAPGFVETPLLTQNEDMDEAALEGIVAMHPIGRLGRPEEIAQVAAWLLLDAPDFLTGAYIPVDGGYLSR